MTRTLVFVRDRSGATAVEFALIAPVFLTMLIGTYDLGHMLYVNSMLQGAIQQAARASTIEGASVATQDAIVATAVRAVMPGATVSFSRKNYSSFSNVARAEDYIEVGGNPSRCDAGESYEDANGNGVWDTDRGRTGQGGARDAVLYTVTVNYTRPFAMAGLLGFSNTVTQSTETVLRNQPYNLQAVPAPVTRTCP